jgi:hypothetical protein
VNETLTGEQAEGVWAILTEICGATSDYGFVYHQTTEHVTEWRFMGALGFGGKFWRTRSTRPDGTWGDWWHVNCYPEDVTERLATIVRANAALWELQRKSET